MIGEGSLCADALRNVANGVAAFNFGTAVQIGVIASGTIRGGIYPGETGSVTFTDTYNALPLGTSPYDPSLPGYPLMSIYATGAEVYTMCEVGLTLSHMFSSGFYLNFSGLQIDYSVSGSITFSGVQAVRGYSPLDTMCLGLAGGFSEPVLINPAGPGCIKSPWGFMNCR